MTPSAIGVSRVQSTNEAVGVLVMRLASLIVAPGVVLSGLGVVAAPPASADCTNAGGVTICSQGDVRGPDTGEGAGSVSGPVVPYPCEYDWYCDDWDLDVIVDPGPPGRPGIGGPGRPGIGGPGGPGIGPR